MLIIVKMPTIVGILTNISLMNTIYESLKARKVYFSAFLILVAAEITCSVEFSMNKPLMTSGSGSIPHLIFMHACLKCD